MTYTNSCCFRTLAGIAGRIVYGIFDITILDKINDFFHCHHCTVILRFLCGCAKMWQCDYVINSGNLCIWEICYVLSNLSACKCLDHIIIIYKNISCKVQDLHAILHHGKCILIDHALRRIKRRYMYSNVITLFINIFYILDVFYMAGKSPCCIDRHIVLVISTVIIYFTTIRMVAPIKEMAAAAKKIGRGDFDIQLPEYSESEFNDLASAFNEMAASLKSYDTMRNSFIANVSHELRTPMTSIGGFVDGMLDKTIPPEEQEHYLKIISSEVHRLTRLVRSMLNLAKIEAGELKPNFTSFSVLDPIVDTLVTFEKRLEEKQIEIRGLDTDKIYRLWADNDLIHQVIYNLLENAIKFVDKGGYISFHFEEVGYLTVIYIRNSGEGLSQEELSLVFDRFYKTDKSRGMDATGVGLGLNIVRSIIKLHGGKIQVRSVLGEYTEFMFSLPNKDIS